MKLRYLLLVALAVLGGCSTAQKDKFNTQVATIASQQLCVQTQVINACGPAAASALPALIAGGASAAVAGTGLGACALLHLPEANKTCGVTM